ncbi:hypothetical protein DFS34DRAFT_27688 [Phlyctochytrium arcticum]|nr:hypothetical protein DFS34DRAFT_27688 [Phlyctochytrium arcticum]
MGSLRDARHVGVRLFSRFCRPFYACRAIIVFAVLVPVLFVYVRLSMTPANSPSSRTGGGREGSFWTGTKNPSDRSDVKTRWTSWDYSSGPERLLAASECPSSWHTHPDLDDFQKLIPTGRKGALVIPWIDRRLVILKPGKAICGWIIIKGLPSGPSSRRAADSILSSSAFTTPLEDGPWLPVDAFNVTAIGSQHGYEIPINVPERYTQYLVGDDEYRIYDLVLLLRDPDLYHLEVLLEYSDLKDLESLSQDAAYPSRAHLPIVVNNDGTPTMLTIQVQGKPISRSTYLGLPHCQHADHVGRWVNASLLAKSPIASSWASEEDETHDDLTGPLESYDGRVWVPYECRYRRWSYRTFRDKCLSRWYHETHWWGDHNIRRSLKTLTTAGAWCKVWYDESSSECQCDDGALHVPDFEVELKRQSTIRNIAGAPNISLSFLSVDGFTAQEPLWREWMHQQHWAETRLPSAVIVNLPVADLVSSTRTQFRDMLSQLADQLRETYAARGIPIILRTPQHSSHPTSRLRTKLLSQYFAKYLINKLGLLTQISVWDVYHLGETAIQEARNRIATCKLGSATRDLVDWENSILMNAMCNQRLAAGKLKVASS